MFKKLALLIALFLFVAFAARPAARRIAWDTKDRPRMSLAQAMQIGREALIASEGLPKDDETFYCLGGGIAITSSKDGDWTFTFGSKENGQRWVIVDLDGVTSVQKDPPFY
jgi:hypothetical protein